MNSKFLVSAISFAAMFIALVSSVSADSISFGVSNKYVGSNLGVFSFDPVSQTGITLDFDKGLYASVLCTVGLDDARFKSNFGDELDYTIGWCGKVSSFSLDLSAAWWDMSCPANFVALTAKATKKLTNTISLSLTVGQYISTDTTVFDGGNRVTVGMPFGKALSRSMVLVVNPQVVYDDGIVRKDPAFVFKPYLALVYKAGKVSWNVLEVTGYSLITRNVHDGRTVTGKDHVVFGSKAVWAF